MSQPVRVVVKLPYNKPENAPPDPPKIEWTPEKADILWKVIEIQRTRAVDSAADWKGLAAHLEVPLPYLLYRVNARFQEEIRGLKDIQGALSPPSPQQQQFPVTIDTKPPTSPTTSEHNKAAVRRLSSGTPLDVRARLNSLSKISTSRHKKSSTSSSIMTLQAPRKPFTPLMRPTSPSSSGDDEADSSDEEAIKEEEAERIAEEEDALTRKLVDLQKMMTSDALGLVSGTTRHMSSRTRDRGRSAPLSRSGGSFAFSNHSTSRSGSHSISSASSRQGSIPEIPSPASERSGNMAVAMPRTMLNNQRTSKRDYQDRHLPLMDRTGLGDLSNQGSEASSFSDLSDASISTSAMEDAIMSNLGSNNNSHFSHHRSRLSSRTQSSIPQ